MNRYYLLIVTSFLFSNSFSSGIPLEDFISKRGSPVSKRIWAIAQTPDKTQEAKERGLKRKRSEENILSPGQLFPTIKRERKALEEFTNYTGSHLPRKGTPLPDETSPLNASTVLSAALKLIKFGEKNHFMRCSRYCKDQENLDAGHHVLQVEVDFGRIDYKGRTNLERMKIGRAPKGPDGKSMNLHHLNQGDGLLVELTRSTHTKLYGDLHLRLEPGSSRINREEFDSFRTWYWKQRASEEVEDRALKKTLFPPSKAKSSIRV